MRIEDFDSDKLYMVSGEAMRRVVRVALKLYKEKRRLGDEQRDMAQLLQATVDEAFEFEEDEDEAAEATE